MGRVSEEKRRRKKIREEKESSQKKEDAGARKGRKVANHFVFPMVCASGWSKSRLAKAAGAEPSGRMKMKTCMALRPRSTLRVAFWEHQIFRFAKMILLDRCSISYDLASFFRGKCNTLDRWNGKNRKMHWYEAVSSALNFSFWKEVSQNCFVFDVGNSEN